MLARQYYALPHDEFGTLSNIVDKITDEYIKSKRNSKQTKGTSSLDRFKILQYTKKNRLIYRGVTSNGLSYMSEGVPDYHSTNLRKSKSFHMPYVDKLQSLFLTKLSKLKIADIYWKYNMLSDLRILINKLEPIPIDDSLNSVI